MKSRAAEKRGRLAQFLSRYRPILIGSGFACSVLLPIAAVAENFEGYRTTTLEAVVKDWNAKTKNDGPGISFSQPEKIRFVVTMRDAPKPCNNSTLRTVLTMMNFADLLKQVSVTHCLTVTSSGDRAVVAYVQDVLIPGIKSDVRIGGLIEVYADFLAYQVNADRSRNAPILLVSRFEPR